MSFIDFLRNESFYNNWEEKFEEETEQYVTPNNSVVKGLSARVVSRDSETDVEKALDAWRWTYNNIKYKLSKRWKTPEETVSEGTGDCEDVTFLIASMLPNMGVKDNVIVLGKLKHKGKEPEYHTWNVVGNRVIDATGSMESVEKAKYIPETRYEVNIGEQ